MPSAENKKGAADIRPRPWRRRGSPNTYCCGLLEVEPEPMLLFFVLPILQVSETMSTLLTANVLSLLLDVLIPAELLLEAAVLESVELDPDALPLADIPEAFDAPFSHVPCNLTSWPT